MRERNILSLHLHSSSLFAVGTVIPILIYTIGYYNKKNFAVNVVVMESVAWTFLTCHVLPEMIIDLNTFPKAERRRVHMRYGKGPCMNFMQSILFAASCIFQGIYFASAWSDPNLSKKDQAELEAYEILSLIAGHLWLLSGILSLCSVGSLCCGCKRDERIVFWDRLANDIYFWTTIALFAAGYFTLFYRRVAHVLHIVVRILWCVLGVYYLIHDLVEEYLFRRWENSVDDNTRRRHKDPLVVDSNDESTRRRPKEAPIVQSELL